jgi:acetyl esterase/lipase
VTPLDPQVEALRQRWLAAGVRPVHQLTVAEARAAELAGSNANVLESVAEVRDLVLPGTGGPIAARLYLPEAEEPPPVLAYFFGGGWVLGSLDIAEPVCRRLANAAACAVVSVAYRRAPEDPFPAAVEDCYAATCWLAENGAGHGLDATRLAVSGASSGGNLAAAVATLARDRGGPPLAFQLLVYPPLDHRAATPSMRELVQRPFFGPEDVAWCWSHYLADSADGERPAASPLRAGDFRGLPPALVITAEVDPLRDEGELYAARLREDGVPTDLVRFEGVMHGFFSLADELDAAVEAQELAASALRRAFAAARI